MRIWHSRVSADADELNTCRRRPQILHTLETMQITQRHLQQLWQYKKNELDQGLQLKIFEKDVEEVGYTACVRGVVRLHTMRKDRYR